MNTAKIKAYAQQARRDFIQAVTEKAHVLGLSKDKIEPAEVKGDYAIIGGRPFPKEIEEPRQRLIKRIQQNGFDLVMRTVAYTWFNRFVALRYMGLHDYHDHGYRVLSNRNGSEVPEILEHAAELDLPGLNKDKVAELRLAGDKDNELFRLLIFAQCDALNRSMPFLFEKINHETELLLPDNLLHSNSPIRKLVNDIDEADWENVEIIGWIYQFYISERKDEVIGKVVKSEDIPAATQLFTPNWIVKYMVQNTLGRQWLATYPDSSLRDKMEYYIEPAEQTEEVQKQLEKIIPNSIDPESLTLLDPACGSGHILVEAYDLLKSIYQERGYRKRDIPRLVLEKNLYGLEIDDRAAQLAGFALTMKARTDDRRILNGNPPKLNLMAIQSSAYIDPESLAKILLKEKVIRFKDDDKLFPEFEKQRVLIVAQKPDVRQEDLVRLLDLFSHGKTLGSLITIPDAVAERLKTIKRLIDEKLQNGDLFERESAEKLRPFVKQAILLSQKYDCVVANPPYMGNKHLNPLLKKYLKTKFKNFEKDLFSAFIIRNKSFTKDKGRLGFMSPFVWMFISTYTKLRKNLIDRSTLTTLVQLEYSGFAGATVPICSFTLLNNHFNDYTGSFIRLSDFRGVENQGPKTLEAIQNNACGWFYIAKPDDFKKIPGSPVAYWVPDNIKNAFSATPLEKLSNVCIGMKTGDNDLFVKRWTEVDIKKIGFKLESQDHADSSHFSWFPYNKGGKYRKWYGNAELILNWKDSGENIKSHVNKKGVSDARLRPSNKNFYFKKGISWTFITSSYFGVRINDTGFFFDVAGSSLFPHNEKDIEVFAGFLNSKLTEIFLSAINPTLNMQIENIKSLPIKDINKSKKERITAIVKEAESIARSDWDSSETSWDFTEIPWASGELKAKMVSSSLVNWQNYCNINIQRMKKLEEENNCLFIEAYGLQNDLSFEVSDEQIAIIRSDPKADVKSLISYSIGCMMGRYSLDEPGLIYAHTGNLGFDLSRYKSFPADDDGIIPIMDLDWFPDDAANRFTEFLRVAWLPKTLVENLKFVADSLKPKRGETPTDTIRRYLCMNFFKNHLKTYKKRPIYWLFSSGKQKAFECLVYLHRYNESTLSRMRSSYVTPLQGKFNARIDYLRNEIDAATTASAQRKLQKELDLLKKKQAELSAFDDELRHYADMRITLDLDDGVKVNYGKFGNLLAEKKTVTGKK